MDRKVLVLSLLPVVATLGMFLAANSDAARVEALDTITAAELKSIVSFLAADEMRGREADSLPNQIAARYLGHSFEMRGLEPAGDDGGYYQHVALFRAEMGQDNQLRMTVPSRGESFDAEILADFAPALYTGSGEASGPLAFVGYGISASGLGYDDYLGIDVRGRVVVMLEGEPGEKDPDSPFEGVLSSEYSKVPYKIRNAQDHGAVGAIFIPAATSGRRSRSPWNQDGTSRPLGLEIWSAGLEIPAVRMTRRFFDESMRSEIKIEEVVGRIDDQYLPQSRLIDSLQAMIRTDVTHNKIQVENVLAKLPGSDPLLRHEFILIGAHFDHVGANGVRIFNGADDDASGTAGVLEIAEAFAQNPVKPRRTILFSLWNAEEKGLLGARHYVQQPLYPLQDTVGVFQLDMIGRNQEVNDPGDGRFGGLEMQTAEQNENTLNVIGSSRSNDMRLLVEQNNSETGIELLYDLENHPLKMIARSDHWPFLVNGVPALFFTTGLHPDYHQTTDTAEKINYQKMERVTRFVFRCAWDLANRSTRPVFDRNEANPAKDDR